MANTYEPYIPHYPGEAITSDDSNKMQVMIREDIGTRIDDAIEAIDKVPGAGDADKLEGKSFDEIKEEIIRAALSQIPERTGFMKVFKRLKVDEESVLEHGLLACPLVDVYQLDYFRVVASEDGYKFITWVNFFLYHSSEKRIGYREGETGPVDRIPIEPTEGHPYKIPFQDMLELYGVEYDDDSSLGDVETEFWGKFSGAPNDEMDDDQHAHSPWFDRCCREERTVGMLKKRDDWNELWFQMRPRKTIHYPVGLILDAVLRSADEDEENNLQEEEVRQILEESTHVAPTEIQVAHFDFERLGLTLMNMPALPNEWFDEETGIEEDRREMVRNELKVMVLLKV